MRHKDRTALVTGGCRGIGLAVALRLAEEGADVAIISISPECVAAGVERIRALGRRSVGVPADVSKTEEVERAFGLVTQELGDIHYLVNNAGVTRDQLLLRMKDEDWDRVINVNLRGAFLCTRQVTRSMMKNRFGRIVNISSIVGLGGQVAQANYAASKAGLIGLTKSVAKELGSRGITCNAVAPGYIQTEMTRDLPEEFRSWAEEHAPLRRLGSVEDVAGVVSFLLSDDAAFITGQTLVVDGGLTL
ncbi:MAG: beta-ketoacyl-ACP reductase [Fimbriimonadales bacterium]